MSRYHKRTLYPRDLKRLGYAGPGPDERAGSPPKARGQCSQIERPCPFVACRYHLFLNVTDKGGVQFPFGTDPAAIADMPTTCALDVAAGEPLTLRECGSLMALNRERARQIEHDALVKFRAYFREKGIAYSGEAPAETEAVGAPDGRSFGRMVRLSSRHALGRRVRKIED